MTAPSADKFSIESLLGRKEQEPAESSSSEAPNKLTSTSGTSVSKGTIN